MKYALSNVIGDPFWLTTIPMAIVGWAVALVGSIINNSSDPSHFPVFSWWGLAFEILVIIMTLHTALSNQIRMYRLAILGFLSVATVYTTNSTNNFVWRDNGSSGAAAAGHILVSIINFVWILYFGTTHDEPVHTYIDSFAAYKKSSVPKGEFQRRMRERRDRRQNVNSSQRDASWSNSQLGTSGQPYRTSDVPRNISIGAPTGFIRQTNPQDPQAENPLRSTYLYSVDQLHRHGLNSHEVESEANLSGGAPATRASAGAQLYSSNRPDTPDTLAVEQHLSDEDEDDIYESTQTVARARARFSYDARISDGEIPFKQGEILDVCDMRGNWWYCKRGNGDVGICPRNYLEVLDESLL